MIGFILTDDEARDICRVDGPENDDLIMPMRDGVERYIKEYVGDKWDFSNPDPRIKTAAQLLLQITFRPNEDKQGNIRAHVTALLNQIVVNI